MLDPGGAAVGPEALPAGLADAQGRFDDAVNDFSALLATRCCPPGFLSTASRSLFACSIAFKGVILDADGSTLVDLFEDFDIPPKTVNFALNVDTTNVQATCAEVLRHVEDNLLGYTDGGLTFEECRRQSTDANGVCRRFIAAGEGHGFSQGTVDTFRTMSSRRNSTRL